MSAVLILAIFTGDVLAQVKAYPVDTWHSKIGFAVKFGGLFDVEGRFTDFSGTVVFDEQDLSKLSASIIIDANSVNTGVKMRDDHLRRDDFFDVEKYPEITFNSKKAVEENGNFQLVGDLSMHGITKEVAIPFSLIHGEKPDSWKNFRVSLAGSFKLNRTDFGIGDIEDIAEEVTIDLMISSRILNTETIALFSRPFGAQMIDKLLNGSLKEARKHFDLLQSQDDRDAAKPSSFTFLNLKLVQDNKLDGAIQACKLGIEIFPDHAPLYTSLANTYFQQGQFKKAQEAIEKALELDESSTMAIELKKLLSKE